VDQGHVVSRVHRVEAVQAWMSYPKDKGGRATKRTCTLRKEEHDRWKRRKTNASDGRTKRKCDEGEDGRVHPSKRNQPTVYKRDEMAVVHPTEEMEEEMAVGTDANERRWNEDEQPHVPLPPSLHEANVQIPAIAPFEYLVQQNIRQHNMQVVPWTPAPNSYVELGGRQDRAQPEKTDATDETRPVPNHGSTEPTEPTNTQDTDHDGTIMDTSMDEGHW